MPSPCWECDEYDEWCSYESDEDVAAEWTDDATESERCLLLDCSAAEGIRYDCAWICSWYEADCSLGLVRLEIGGSENGGGAGGLNDGAETDEVTTGRPRAAMEAKSARRGGLPPTLVVKRRRIWTSS